MKGDLYRSNLSYVCIKPTIKIPQMAFSRRYIYRKERISFFTRKCLCTLNAWLVTWDEWARTISVEGSLGSEPNYQSFRLQKCHFPHSLPLAHFPSHFPHPISFQSSQRLNDSTLLNRCPQLHRHAFSCEPAQKESILQQAHLSKLTLQTADQRDGVSTTELNHVFHLSWRCTTYHYQIPEYQTDPREAVTATDGSNLYRTTAS